MLFGYCGQSHWDALLDPQPMSSSFNLYSWECTAHGGDHGEERPQLYLTELLWCPVSLQCSPAPELALPNHIYYNLVLQHLLLYMDSPWQSKEQVGALLLAGEKCPSLLWREQEGLGAKPPDGPHFGCWGWAGTAPTGKCPSQTCEEGGSGQGAAGPHPCSCFMDPFETGQHCRMELVQLFSLPAGVAPVLGV